MCVCLSVRENDQCDTSLSVIFHLKSSPLTKVKRHRTDCYIGLFIGNVITDELVSVKISFLRHVCNFIMVVLR